MFKRIFFDLILLGLVALAFGCSKSDDFQACDASSSIHLDDNICLSFEHGQLSQTQRQLIENLTISGIALITNLMPINDLHIRIVNNPNLVIPEIGMGGYNPEKHEVILSINEAFPGLDSALQEHFIPQLAHEIHHAKRRRSVGYGSTLLEAVVSEGLADHFSIEVSGITPPPWSVALQGDELDIWIDEASMLWNQPYNHRNWFVGTSPEIPRWVGYSIGFEIVKEYLSIHTDRFPSTLHDEPASSFEP